MAVGIGNIEGGEAEDEDLFPETTPAEKAEYVDERYSTEDGTETDTAYTEVYVRDESNNALSKEPLLDTLQYKQTVLENESVAVAIPADGEITSIASIVAAAAADDPDATLDEQIGALESTSEAEVTSIVSEALSEEPEARQLVSNSYDPETTSAESHQIIFVFETTEDGEINDAVTSHLFETASDRENPEYFTLNEHALVEANEQMNENTIGLILPVALALILGVLAFTYRDLVDVIVGMVGVVVSIIWMFGILGWLEISAGITMIVGPVLIAALSIDYGFHIFMRYREQRDSGEPIRPPMNRAVRSVSIALCLVTITAGIGFLSNIVNPLENIRDLGLGITFGVISAFLIFVTLVPALKVSIDQTLERFRLDRQKHPLGDGAVLRPFLQSGVVLAKRAAPIVVVVALVATAGSAAAWTALDEEPFEQQTEPAPEWMGELPGPLAWEDPEYNLNEIYVQEQFQPVAQNEGDRIQILIQGDVTNDESLRESTKRKTPVSSLRVPGTLIPFRS